MISFGRYRVILEQKCFGKKKNEANIAVQLMRTRKMVQIDVCY